MANKQLADAISDFGRAAVAKLSNPAVAGAPEDQLRTPLEHLIREDMAFLCGWSNLIELVGETTISASRTRPDFAVTRGNMLIGFIEVKAPGKDLMNLLHVLGRLVLLEPKQADLLHRILGQGLIKVASLGPAADNARDS